MKINPASLLLAWITLLLWGCASMLPPEAVTHAALTDPANYYEPTVTVELLDASPDRPFIKIARLETLGNERVLSEVFLIEDMRITARLLGANAIIVPHGRSRQYSPDGIHWIIEGDAIRYQ
ncbi:MAG TPA: hypothetical protein HPQ00_00935 [Magnetococcales bacterium]|nr:hypothetical protein [Magnetococcales bacterium]